MQCNRSMQRTSCRRAQRRVADSRLMPLSTHTSPASVSGISDFRHAEPEISHFPYRTHTGPTQPVPIRQLHHKKLPWSPIPTIPPLSFCMRATYCLDTVFHAAIYFSMHMVKQPSSLRLSDRPGVGTHFSKQCSLSF